MFCKSLFMFTNLNQRKLNRRKKEGEFINVNVNRVVWEYECINMQTSYRSENILKPSAL